MAVDHSTAKLSPKWRPCLRRSSTVAIAVLCGAAVSPAWAAGFDYFYGYRAEFSDNIQRVAVNKENELINLFNVGLSYQDHSYNLDIRFVPSVDYLDYKYNTFPDEARLTLDSSVLWKISPKYFTWSLDDNAYQVRLNATQPATPANNALANYFSTGPDYYVHLGSVNTLQLGARYNDVYVEDTNLNSQRGQGYFRWLYTFSPTTTLSLNAETEDAKFDDQVTNTNFTRHDVFLGIENRRPQSALILNLGNTIIDRDGADKVRGNFGRLSWTHRINTETTVGAVAESNIADTGTDLAASAAASNNPDDPTQRSTSQNLIAQDVFRAKVGEVFVDRAGSRVTVNVRGFQRRYEFELSPLDDREERGGSVGLAYAYSAVVSANVFGSRTRTVFSKQVLTNTDTSVGISWSYQINREVTVAAQLTQDERDSTTSGFEYLDNRFVFSVTYNSGLIPRTQ